MEPWPPSHGYTGQRVREEARRKGFNGAMTSQPWIHDVRPLNETFKVKLQWSHGLPAMDTQVNGSEKRLAGKASMEP